MSAVGVSTVGVSTVGVSTVGVSTVGVSTVGVSTVGVSAVGVSAIGVSTIGANSGPAPVLLTDAQQRKTLAAMRSLGEKGVRVLAAEDTRWATAFFSKHCARGLVCPNPRREPNKYWEWLKQTLESNPGIVLFPMDDVTMEIAIEHREQVAQLCRTVLPPTESFQIAADKGLAALAAMEAGLECPKTVIVQPEDLGKIRELAKGLGFPLVIKPRKSSGSRGIVVVRDETELVEHYQQVHEGYPYPVLQDWVGTGTRFDVGMLFNQESELEAAFVQQEIRHFPLERGPSTVQESVWRPDLIELAARLLRKLNWVGIAEVEFMVDSRDGRVKFMEINPRLWGSLHLAVLAGVDFPFLLYRLALGEKDLGGAAAGGAGDLGYEVGLKCRWSLPGDILHFIYNKKRGEMEPSFWAGKKSGIHDDIISLSDPGPVLGFMLAGLHYLPDREMWRFLLHR